MDGRTPDRREAARVSAGIRVHSGSIQWIGAGANSFTRLQGSIMIKRLTTTALFLALFSGYGLAQDNLFPKFKLFKDVAPGIDFYADERGQVEPFAKAVIDARGRMKDFLGDRIAAGAVFICSTLAQKDTVYDLRVFKRYKWYLVQLTAEAQREERTVRMQAQAAAAAALGGQGGDAAQGSRGGGRGGDQVTRGTDQGARGGERGAQGGRGGSGNPSSEMRAAAEARAATAMAAQICYAILMSSLDNEKPYRISRLDDMSRSPLNDWLDVALAAYATGNTQSSYRTLQERVDDCFPLDDVLSMSRPFVAQVESSGGGGGGAASGPMMAVLGAQGGGRGGGGQAGGRGGAGRVLSKDVVDRMVFDAQATAFFTYLLEKAGADKVKNLVQKNLEKTETVDVVMNLLDPNIDKVEQDFMAWVKTQK